MCYLYTLTQYMTYLYNLLEILIILVPILLSVAYMTIIERKVMGSMQRRIGPNIVGYYGVLQPFADALKLVVKEQIIPSQSTKSLFFIAPMLSLIFSLLGWGVIPFGPGLALSDFSLGILYSLALSSIGVYGILFAGWSANSKYAFLGSLRSTAQMISYELIYSAAVLSVILLCGSFNITKIIEAQQNIWYVIPLLPIFVLFFVSALAETNRTPFDLPEAESELVAGFMTEHSGMIFVFFFLAEYSSIVLMSTFTAILFLGGYNTIGPISMIFTILSTPLEYFGFVMGSNMSVPFGDIISYSTNRNWSQKRTTFFGVRWYSINIQRISLAIKSVFFMFVFVWIRATLPRLRYDQLMVFCWTRMLPVAIRLLILIPSIVIAFEISPVYLILSRFLGGAKPPPIFLVNTDVLIGLPNDPLF
uniref:NADH dehydrogenase subunit 1 n=1 Tax=Tilletia controversa TaxID=13291 RepID=UPI002434C649|nr:NADH dehydrogenase subunit 1 [Tilletia controversa]WEX30821.1 NADH dehydrogenase subunit 1 [Tilletia controversa]